MRALRGGLLVLLPLLLAGSAARAEQRRFDVQPFRPTPGPRDLLIVAQTQPLSHLSVAAGAYLSFSLDPLVLLNREGDRLYDVVTNRFRLDLMAAIGMWDWVEVGLVMPIVLFQQSDNLEAIGTEGKVQSTVLGDLSLITKVPVLRRLPYVKGFGAALSLRVNFPTGSMDNFAGDGGFSFNPTILADYRFAFGGLIALQTGVHFRPAGEFLDLSLGPMFTAALGGEVPIVRRWGLGTVAGVYANVPLTKLPESPRQIPAEAMLGLRWYADFGVTFTTGLNFGADCGFGVPTFRFFLSAVWVPLKTREHEAILHFKKPPDDPDGDGLIGEQDHCPRVPGPPENHGCPEIDTDKDGIPDQLDKCPTLPGRYEGCPRVFASRNKIRVMEKVHFATDQDVILPESFSVLEEVSEIILAHPEWQEILVEGHCDFRASDAYNLDLSNRRANAVRRFLESRGVEPSRLRSQGFGRSRPIADNRTEEGMALNRRVEFTLMKVAKSGQQPVQPGGKR